MSVVVQKYGGSSLEDLERLESVAEQIVETHRQGNQVVVVVSAMGDTTDELLEMARGLTDAPSRRELDMLLSVGERIAMALLSIAIQKREIEAVSLTGSQCGIITTHNHSDARIMDVRPFRVQDELEMGKVVIVAGYQGTSYRREVTTLGRGGSDTTAVALAAALDAEACEIYSDVEGIYSADPGVVLDAEQLLELSHDEMLEMARSGARVLNEEAVEFARRAKIALYARKAHGAETGGTVVRGGGFQRRIERSEQGRPAVAVSHIDEGLWVRAGAAADRVLELLDENDIVFCNWQPGEFAEIFVGGDGVHGFGAVEEMLAELGGEIAAERAGLVSIVGQGLGKQTRWPLAARRRLEDQGIDALGVGVEGARISCVVSSESVEEATRALHDAFVVEKAADPLAPI